MAPLQTLTPRAAPAVSRYEAEEDHLPCELCGVSRADVLFHLADALAPRRRAYTFVRCRRCGLTYRNPRPLSFDAIRTLTPPGARQRSLLLSRALSAWARSLKEKSVLVLGGGGAGLAGRLLEKGFRVCGVETDLDRMDRDLQHLKGPKPPFHRKALSELELPEEVFGGAVALDSLGCLPSPTQALLEIYRLLEPGGRLLVTVPNAGSTGFSVFGPNWALLHPSHTLHAFDPRTLAALVEEAGFRILSLSHEADASAWARSGRALLVQTGRRRLARLGQAASLLVRAALWIAAQSLAWSERGDRLILLAERR